MDGVVWLYWMRHCHFIRTSHSHQRRCWTVESTVNWKLFHLFACFKSFCIKDARMQLKLLHVYVLLDVLLENGLNFRVIFIFLKNSFEIYFTIFFFVIDTACSGTCGLQSVRTRSRNITKMNDEAMYIFVFDKFMFEKTFEKLFSF